MIIVYRSFSVKRVFSILPDEIGSNALVGSSNKMISGSTKKAHFDEAYL